MANRRLFTPTEANKTLPLVKRVVADILEAGRELRGLVEMDHAEREKAGGDGRVAELENRLAELQSELAAIGCDYKDWGFEHGLVDFPAQIEGRPVLLCWRTDEPSVAFFHPVEAGYRGRQPIPAEMLEASD